MKYSTHFTAAAGKEIEITATLDVTHDRYVRGHDDEIEIAYGAKIVSVDDIEIEFLTVDGIEISNEFFHLWEKIALDEIRNEILN